MRGVGGDGVVANQGRQPTISVLNFALFFGVFVFVFPFFYFIFGFCIVIMIWFADMRCDWGLRSLLSRRDIHTMSVMWGGGGGGILE